MGFFKKDVAKTADEAESKPEKSSTGLVSGVLSASSHDDGDSPHGDIVERRFGPGPGREQSEVEDPIEADEPSIIDEAAALDEEATLETLELEVDPMAHIGRSTTITGDIVAEEDLEIQGTVEGSVKVGEHRVTVGEEGVVKARIEAKGIVVVGRVDGDVEASESVEVKAGGCVCGNVKAPRVILQDGAIVVGGLDMSAALSKAPRGDVPQPADPVPPRPALKRVETDQPGVMLRDHSA
jgi:cytoskeletal protein CcmA (bactofilin family)